jgi:tetratricopeptide (TPR) repeat protein/predicted Ser/Thr protein kinase
MTPERFGQIEELYHAAREGTAEERAALLAQTDPELRREVELLLSQQTSGEFLDKVAIRNAPELLEDSTVVVTAPAFLGPYHVESKLGEGGMGEVFRAVDTRLGRAVAIKIMQEQFIARFEREARAIASLNHSNICTLYDVGENYLVMELVEGQTITELLKSGPLPVETALLYASQIAAALVEAHAKGIVHRDLKPGNVMIAKSGVKVLDFGLAKSVNDETVTASRMVMGTPAYMAPEQREGKAADSRSDIYSFGCILYEMLTGSRATPERKPVPSKGLEEIVARCLKTDPAQRWQSAAELASALKTPPRRTGRRNWFIAAAVLPALLAAGYFFFSPALFHPAQKLTDKDIIVLADFVNHTGDSIFDGTLRQGLAIQLEQSPFLRIMDDEQARRVLRLMSLPPDAHITNQVAHDICVREGAAATVDGAIASLGSRYVITLQASACRDGATLAREQVQAIDKEHVLNAVGSAATAMRGKLGESHNSIQKLNRPLEQATTPSLEALQNYNAGYSEMAQGHFLAAVPLFERAIEIDPNFALAYLYLADAFYNAGDEGRRSREYFTRAFNLVNRVSDFERYWITGEYSYLVTGELDKAIDTALSGIRDYPQSIMFHNGLSMIYIDLGRYEEGLKEGLEAARVQPKNEQPYRRQLDAYICLDRLSEARELMDRLRAQGLGGARIHQRYLEMAYVAGDQALIDREIQWFAGKPEEYLSLGLQAANRNLHGQRRESRKLYQRAAETALRRGLGNAASEFQEADARADALAGNCQAVRKSGRFALPLAICGDATHAEKLAVETSKLFPNGTIWNAVQLPEIRAAIELNRGQPVRSVELLVSAAPYERAHLATLYLRGLAYLQLRKSAEATAEFQKIVNHKGANWASAWRYPYWGQFYSLAHLGLARSFALAGDTAQARKTFQDFFELWKDADADTPILQKATAEYKGLQ